eukprot:CFRG7502T1
MLNLFSFKCWLCILVFLTFTDQFPSVLATDERNRDDDITEGLEAGKTTLFKQLIARVAVLEEEVSSLKSLLQHRQPATHDAKTAIATPAAHSDSHNFPPLYKIKQKPYERVMMDLSVSFDVYAGDSYLGEFRQGYPWVRLFWDEINFYDHKGKFYGQLYFSFFRYIGNVPNIFFGTRYCWLHDNEGTLLMSGTEETFIHLMLRAEQPGIDFQLPGSDQHFKSRMTNTMTPRKWLIVNADSGDKVATIEESYIHDVFNRHFSGWSVEVPNPDILDPRIAGFQAAFDLAEQMDTLPTFLRTIFMIAMCFVVPQTSGGVTRTNDAFGIHISGDWGTRADD